METKIALLARQCVARASELHVQITCAESCTGGLVAARITDVPGASEIFPGGVVSYANEIKQRILGVSAGTLSLCGAVSAPCAAQMAEGVRNVMKADLAVSITGIAGPGGGSAVKPVGTVYFGLSLSGKTWTVLRLMKGKDRTEIRAQSVHFALRLIRVGLWWLARKR